MAAPSSIEKLKSWGFGAVAGALWLQLNLRLSNIESKMDVVVKTETRVEAAEKSIINLQKRVWDMGGVQPAKHEEIYNTADHLTI